MPAPPAPVVVDVLVVDVPGEGLLQARTSNANKGTTPRQ
jgi:hypothetical protein